MPEGFAETSARMVSQEYGVLVGVAGECVGGDRGPADAVVAVTSGDVIALSLVVVPSVSRR